MRTSKVLLHALFLTLFVLIQRALQAPVLALDVDRNVQRRVFYEYDDSPLLFDDFASFENVFNRRRNVEAVQERQLDLYRPPFGLKESVLLRRMGLPRNAVVGCDPLQKPQEKTAVLVRKRDAEGEVEGQPRRRRFYPLMVF